MSFLLDHLREVVSLLVPFITWILVNYFSGRPKLVRSNRHSFTYLINEPLRDASGNVIHQKQSVNVASMHVVNSGRTAAKSVEIVFNWEPQHFNVRPSRHYESKTAADGRFSILFANLPLKDVLGFELLAVNSPLPDMVTVTSEQVVGTTRQLALQPVFPRWFNLLVMWLVFSGISANVFLLVTLIQALSR
jgi:hypothetical protein